MRNDSDKAAEKIKTHFLCEISFFRKSWLLRDNVEKYGTARQAKDDITQRKHFSCCMPQATDTHNT